LDKFLRAKAHAEGLVQVQSVTIRWFLKFIGFINSLADVIPPGTLHIKPLQSLLLLQWSPVSQNWDFPLLLDQLVGQASVSMEDPSGQRHLWSLANEGFSIENPLYGRFNDRLGSLSLQTAGFRSVDSGGEISSHQCVRDEGRSSSFGFRTPFEGLGDMSGDRKLHGGCIYQQPGRHKISDSVFSFPGTSVLSEEQHSLFSEACSRQAQCIGRYLLSGSYLPGLGSSPRRFVCNLYKQPSSDVCISIAGRESSSTRRFFDLLGRDERLCVSPRSFWWAR